MPNSEYTLLKKAIVPLLVFLVGFSIHNVTAQVSIAPTALFFDSQNRFSSLSVSNGGQQAQEVTIETEFGYPASENGNLIISRDSLLAEQKSLAPWLKMFPQRFTLQPNQRQVVRFVAQIPGNLEPGGYWTRVKITSNPVSQPIESVGNDQVGAQINLIVEQVIAAHYRTKDANTGVKITSVNFEETENEDLGIISVSMEKTGNAPFIGSIDLSIQNSSGKTVYRANTTNSVYTSITRTFTADIAGWEAGEYNITGTVSSERRDIDQNKLLTVEPVTFSKSFRLN